MSPLESIAIGLAMTAAVTAAIVGVFWLIDRWGGGTGKGARP